MGTGKGTSVLEIVDAFEKASGKVPFVYILFGFAVSAHQLVILLQKIPIEKAGMQKWFMHRQRRQNRN